MQSIRQRLTLSYSLALTATVLVFGALVYVERTQSASREAETQTVARLRTDAEIAVRAVRQQSYPASNPVDTLFQLASGIQGYLDAITDYLFIADYRSQLVYVTPAGRLMLSQPDAVALIQRELQARPLTARRGRLELRRGERAFDYLVQPLDSAGVYARALLVAAQPDPAPFGAAPLVGSMMVVAPIIIAGSALLGYWLAGRSLIPLEVMMQELDEIQDGRTLHRRLGVPTGRDEFSALAQKLNAMLGRIEQSFVALRRFTADASHELNTPLMVLRAGVERSLTHPKTPDEIVVALDETLRQINQMSELVTNLLTLARADEGRASLVAVPADLRQLLAEVEETAEILGEQQGVAVALELPSAPVQVVVDVARIRQLLMNLVTNAVKYTPQGGKVRLALRSDEEGAVVTVQDTGIGIAPGDLPSIFERFWRADPARSRTGDRPGTGLGLAIVKWIVDAHGGVIDVQSRPGRGTTFRVTLPLVAPADVIGEG